MRAEPTVKRAVTFFDGQNLYHAAKEAFGYPYPNYDPVKLATHVATAQNWKLIDVYFYTGIPDIIDDPLWNHFWTAKLAVMGTRKVHTFSRPLRYRNETVHMPDGSTTAILVGREKGIDIRIALDVVNLALEDKFDVAIIFSQDQDISEVADEVRTISQKDNRWIKIACAFPDSPTIHNRRGINGTDWIRIDRTTYDTCIDQVDYRPKKLK